MALEIEDMQKVRLTAVGVSAAGNPTTDLVGPLQWASSNAAVVGMVPLADPDAYAESQGPLGLSTVSVTGLNGSGTPITGTLEIQVKAGPTVAVQVNADPPEPR